MGLLCKWNCLKYKATKPGGKARYSNGQSRCTTCMIFIIWEGVFCPCCGARLKKTPTKKRLKKYVEISI